MRESRFSVCRKTDKNFNRKGEDGAEEELRVRLQIALSFFPYSPLRFFEITLTQYPFCFVNSVVCIHGFWYELPGLYAE
jgi:hypothetical protein